MGGLLLPRASRSRKAAWISVNTAGAMSKTLEIYRPSTSRRRRSSEVPCSQPPGDRKDRKDQRETGRMRPAESRSPDQFKKPQDTCSWRARRHRLGQIPGPLLANDEAIVNQDGSRRSWHACSRDAASLTDGTVSSPVH